MKKLKYGMVFLALLGIGVVSCEKEEIAETENKTVIQPERTLESTLDESTIIDQHLYPGLSVENGVLTFESIAYYESLVVGEEQGNGVDDLVAYLGNSEFNSYGKINKESGIYQDEFMDAIMNAEKVVKIGEWFIYIDTELELVKAISDKETNAYQGLLTNSNRTIRIFSTGDDVLDHLAKNTSPDDRSCGGIGSFSPESSIVSGGGVNHQAYVKFFRAGVYFKLSFGFNTNAPYPSSTTKRMEIMGPEGWCQRRPCGADKITTRDAGDIGENLNANYSYQNTFYDNVRNLNGVYLYVRLKVDGVYTTWTGANVNSPY
jgi:hypothetical protein